MRMALVGRHVRGTLGVVVDRVPVDHLGTMSADDNHSCPDASQVEAKISNYKISNYSHKDEMIIYLIRISMTIHSRHTRLSVWPGWMSIWETRHSSWSR